MEKFPWQRALGLLVLLLFVSLLVENLTRKSRPESQSIPYSAFKQEVRDGNVAQVTLSRVAWSWNALFPPLTPNWVVRTIPLPQVITDDDVVSAIWAAGAATVKALEVAPVRPVAAAVSV